jgi:hypothetical protein
MKSYYGGDLQFSVTSISISEHYSTLSTSFTVSTPDGGIALTPHMPWNDQSSIASPVTSGPVTTDSSWQMFLMLDGAPTPSTTPYIIHFQTFKLDTGNDEWEYDGFLPLYVDY